MPAESGPFPGQADPADQPLFPPSQGQLPLPELWEAAVERVRQRALGDPSQLEAQELYQFLHNTRLVEIVRNGDGSASLSLQAETAFQHGWLARCAAPLLNEIFAGWDLPEFRFEFLPPGKNGKPARVVRAGFSLVENPAALPETEPASAPLPDPEQAWQAAVQQLRGQVSPQAFQTYLEPAQFLAYDGGLGVFTIGVPDRLAQQWLSERLASTAARLLSGITARSASVEFQVLAGRADRLDKPEPPDSLPSQHQNADIESLVLDPAYLTDLEKILEPGAALYYPRYFARHLAHMQAAEATLNLAFQQIAYFRSFALGSGEAVLESTYTEISRWSHLHRNLIEKYLSKPGSYLSHFVRKVPFAERYAAAPEGERWEDVRGLHWREGRSHYVLWKKSGKCSLEVGPGVYKQARSLYRVLRSMPLAPADSERLEGRLVELGVRQDPLRAVAGLLDLPRGELLSPQNNLPNGIPEKLVSVEAVVLRAWGGSDRQLAAQVKAHARKLDEHLTGAERDLLVIPLYFIRNWLPLLASHEQFWAAVLLQDRAYACQSTSSYREHVYVKGGYKTLGGWVGTNPKTVAAWAHPWRSLESQNKAAREKFSPWFSLFVDEICRTRNPANGIDVDFNVLPFTPLAPRDALQFLFDHGLTSCTLPDPGGHPVQLRLQADRVSLVLEPDRQLDFTYGGELLSPPNGDVEVLLPGASLNPPVLGWSERSGYLKQKQQEAAGAWLSNGAQEAGAVSGDRSQEPGAWLQAGAQEDPAVSDRGALESGSPSGDCALKMAPEAYCSALLKLLILKLYGIKKALYLQKAPADPDLDSLPARGAEQVSIRWVEINPEQEWSLTGLLKSIGIHPWNANLLKSGGISPVEAVSWYLYTYTIPASKISASREAMLVACLKDSQNQPYPGSFERLARLSPKQLQELFRTAVRRGGGALGDLDWDRTLAPVKVIDLALLAERLGLAKLVR